MDASPASPLESGMPAMGWNLVRLAMAFTIASKLNGSIETWDTAFLPYFVAIGISFLLLVKQCYDPRDRVPEGLPTPQQLACTGLCSLFFFAMWVGLVLWHLDEP